MLSQPELQKLHPFPARMAPEIISRFLKGKKTLRVLDPMMGSGTTLVTGLCYGHIVSGVDIDPLACLQSRVWCSKCNPTFVRRAALKVIWRAQRTWKKIKATDAFPIDCDLETRSFVRYWFDLSNRRQLCALSSAIKRIKNSEVRDLLWVALSRLIIAKEKGVTLARDLSHSRPHKAFERAPIEALGHFLKSVEYVLLAKARNSSVVRSKNFSVKIGDARRIPHRSESQDLVLTSPPYLNAIDYMRCSKFSLIWMGYTLESLRKIRTESIGSESSRLQSIKFAKDLERLLTSKFGVARLPSRHRNHLIRYAYDLKLVMGEIHRVLRKRGKAVFVMGNCYLRGIEVRNAEIAIALARQEGLRLVSKRVRVLPPNRRYMPPPGAKGSGHSMSKRMRHEIILEMEK